MTTEANESRSEQFGTNTYTTHPATTTHTTYTTTHTTYTTQPSFLSLQPSFVAVSQHLPVRQPEVVPSKLREVGSVRVLKRLVFLWSSMCVADDFFALVAPVFGLQITQLTGVHHGVVVRGVEKHERHAVGVFVRFFVHRHAVPGDCKEKVKCLELWVYCMSKQYTCDACSCNSCYGQYCTQTVMQGR